MPSICDWAGINVPGKRQGVSFRPIVENGSADKQHQPYIVTETSFAQTASTRGWMLRTSQYKYVLYDTGKNRDSSMTWRQIAEKCATLPSKRNMPISSGSIGSY